MTEIPDDVEIETIWVVEVPYTPEAEVRRPQFRRAHLTRIARLIREGRVVEAGGTADLTKAVLLIRAETEAEVLALIEEDVYTSGGVWHSPIARAFGRVIPREATSG
ncbi:MAG TPA: hypothetical protein VIZ22_02370 [Candidatus Limnocylindrales bacterium]